MYRRLGCFYELPFWVWELVPQVLGGFVQVYFTTTISSGSDSKKNSVPCKSVQIWQDWLWGEVWMLTKKIYIYIYNIGSLSLSLLLTHTDTHVRWSDHVLRPVSGVFAEVTKSRLVLKFPSRLACSHTYISPWQQLSCIAPWQHQPVHMDYNFSS